MKLLQIIMPAQQLMVSPYQPKGQICRFRRFQLHLHPHPHRRPATMYKVVLKLHFFPCMGMPWSCMQWPQQKKLNLCNIRFFSLKPLHCKEIFLSENLLLKVASVKLATLASSIKGFMFIEEAPISVKN